MPGEEEGFVIGPNDRTYSVSDIPDMKARIALNPAVAGMLQPLIDRLEAGDFDQPWIGDDGDPIVTTDTGTTLPGAQNQEDIDAALAAALQGAGMGKDFDFSDVMTAADAEELFQNMYTNQLEPELLQKMGTAGFLTNDQVQKAINTALGESDYLSEEDVLRMIQESTGADVDLSNYMSRSDIAEAIKASTSQFLTPEMIQQMITNAQLQGMSEEDIFAMIQDVSGGTMSDDEIMAAIATAQETQYTSLMDQVNKLIADSLAQGMSEEEILALIQTEYGEQMTDDQILQAIADAQEGQYTSLMEEVNALIAQALTDGMSPEQIAALIKEQYGDQMTDDQILQAIATAQEGVPTIQEIEAMIADALANGMSPEAIQTMISDYLGDSGLVSADDIATMIADAVAGIGTTTGGDALTSDAVQQMIDAAISGMPAGLSTEDVQAMLGESGYMGDTGVQGMIDAALQGSLGQGGSINEAIQNALLAVGDTTIDTGTQQPSSPYGTYTSPYGDVDPYALMYNPWYGTTPFAGGTTTGAESGLAGLDLGNPGDYNFDISTEYDEDLFS
jgi:DNA-binding transcriptional regulator YhcF (GntR family)